MSGTAIALLLYVLAWSVGIGLSAAWHQRRNRAVGECIRRPFYWFAFWHAGVIAMCATGGLIGALLFPLVGTLLRLEYTLLQMAGFGLRDGSFYALIWAPGVVLVAAFIHGNNRRRKAQPVA